MFSALKLQNVFYFATRHHVSQIYITLTHSYRVWPFTGKAPQQRAEVKTLLLNKNLRCGVHI
jgi:hypothetical protein